MAYKYSRPILNAISSTLMPQRLNSSLWKTLIQLHLARTTPTRRGCRGGARKQHSTFLHTGPGPRSNAGLDGTEPINLQNLTFSDPSRETTNLHTDLLNIHNNTFSSTTSSTGSPPVNANQRRCLLTHVPALLLSNTMSLAPKIDEIRHTVLKSSVDLACFTETWLSDLIPDNAINIPGYNIARMDRVIGRHGGVCTYIKDSIPYEVLHQYHVSPFEVLWIKARPFRLPRGLSSIIIGTVYHPPSANAPAMLEYLANQLSFIESTFLNCGLILVGDFNKLDVGRFARQFRLKQLVVFPTRGVNTLDLVLTNISEHYTSPEKLPPFGLSDHLSILLRPKDKSKINSSAKHNIMIRDLRPSRRAAFSTFLDEIDWSFLDLLSNCEDKLTTFETVIRTGMDILLPLKSAKYCSNEPAWVTPHLKSLIQLRQKALANGNMVKFKVLRNQVNRERKKCRSTFYQSKVNHLKENNPKQWWKSVKVLCGMDPVSPSNDLRLLSVNQEDGDHSTSCEHRTNLANSINQSFLEPMASFTPLTATSFFPTDCSAFADVTTENSVFQLLAHLKPSKAPGPDGLPSWILKENANVLAKPVNNILNSSYRECRLPSSWKNADITPLPKQKPVLDAGKHLRPISLTPIMSKVAEEIVVERFIKPSILKQIDQRQYGTVPSSSTTYALISMFHQFSKSTDGNGNLARISLLDFRKAFDLIDHHLLVQKLQSLELPEWVVAWVTDFLTSRQQRVKLGDGVFSNWSLVPAGVPQGTKLGPWLYILMINDLDVDGVSLWKYVDDLTLAEIVPKGNTSKMQTTIDTIHIQTTNLKFTFNEDKCKEMCIDFSRPASQCRPLFINGKELELVRQVKVLGIIISNDLKWNCHVNYIIKKASKRMYFLRQLKRAKMPVLDMVRFYSTCIRSVVEYGSPVFHYALPSYLSDDIERIQKRALSIIFGPDLSYTERMVASNLTSLACRRQLLCEKLFKKIVKDPSHKLYSLLPAFNVNARYSLRNNRIFIEPRYSTERFKKSFIMASIRNL